MLWRTLKTLIHSVDDVNVEPLTARVAHLIRRKKAYEAKTLLLENIDTINKEPKLLSLMGEVEYHLDNNKNAEQLCLQALHINPGTSEAHYVLSLIYYDASKTEDALAQALFANKVAPNEVRILAQLGLCCIATQNFVQGKEILRQAALLDPDNVQVLNNLGICLHAMHEFDLALYYLQRAISLDLEYKPAKENLRLLYGIETISSHFDCQANILQTNLGDLDSVGILNNQHIENQTELALEEEFDSKPDDLSVSARLILHYIKKLNLDAARDVLEIALARNPTANPLLILRGRLAHLLGQKKQAREIYSQVLESEPNNVEALLGLGKVLREFKLLNDALIPIEKAVAIEESSNTLMHLVLAQVNACNYEAALKTCDRIEQLYPALTSILHSSRAVSHAYLGHFETAMRFLELGHGFESQTSSFTVFKGMLYLQHENYTEGWENYRYRALYSDNLRLLPYPIWNGEDLSNKTILVLAEQGLGDQVMFASCLTDLLARRPNKVVLEANHRVAKTLARSFPQIEVIPSKQIGFDWIPKKLTIDYYLPIADLARHFRQSKEDFPIHKGYLQADPQRSAYWKTRLDKESSRIKVGFSWRGGTQETRQYVRSIKIEELEHILSDSRFQFVNLQYGPVQSELAQFISQRGLAILDWPEAVQDLDEFSALISVLDLVITVCNTTVHYSGALGKECWVMTPHIPEWRYGIDSPRMPWYPSTRMFRQETTGDWEGVLFSVRASLNEYFASRSSTA